MRPVAHMGKVFLLVVATITLLSDAAQAPLPKLLSNQLKAAKATKELYHTGQLIKKPAAKKVANDTDSTHQTSGEGEDDSGHSNLFAQSSLKKFVMDKVFNKISDVLLGLMSSVLGSLLMPQITGKETSDPKISNNTLKDKMFESITNTVLGSTFDVPDSVLMPQTGGQESNGLSGEQELTEPPSTPPPQTPAEEANNEVSKPENTEKPSSSPASASKEASENGRSKESELDKNPLNNPEVEKLFGSIVGAVFGSSFNASGLLPQTGGGEDNNDGGTQEPSKRTSTSQSRAPSKYVIDQGGTQEPSKRTSTSQSRAPSKYVIDQGGTQKPSKRTSTSQSLAPSKYVIDQGGTQEPSKRTSTSQSRAPSKYVIDQGGKRKPSKKRSPPLVRQKPAAAQPIDPNHFLFE